MRNWNQKAALRWAVPLVAALLLVGGGTAITSLPATADNSLPERTPAQLLEDVQKARIKGVSGTVQQTANLGIPDLPGVGGERSSDLKSLISGTHTLRVWSAGPDKSRVALLGEFGESDVIRNGDEAWIWSSKENTAHHYTGLQSKTDEPSPGVTPRTPQDAADEALRALDSSTKVSATNDATVAGRPAYELTLTPRDGASRVAQVRIAIDGTEHVPVRVQVRAAGKADPPFEVGFSKVDFNEPDDDRFTFTPPPGAKVHEESVDPGEKRRDGKDGNRRDGDDVTVVGTGWTAVSIRPLPAEAKSGDLQRTLQALPKVSGDWGSGRLLDSTLFSVLVTDDGQIVAGAVAPDALYSALNAKRTG
ncbi:hypothetical protein LWF01_18995 [Saxibacter everestensis]|uniref:Outer membrane lipoprotein-sorting protein n=1 Tax=Saxibacter everestensis TaxID=2909229 RepID=A0ABY8QVD4_9MICO|nr:hypothetical protein LWF01_18995 [Brevibacteriaceae bacterium ZFBP1038]